MYAATKSKYRYRMDVALGVTIQLPTITPNSKDIVREINNTVLQASNL
jgi:hypothetical protein